MPTQPLHVFFCYAPQDEEARKALESHLAMLVREGYLASVSSRSLGGGGDDRAAVERQIDRADLLIVLVSADLIASDRLYDVELRRVLERRARHPEDVMGVLLRPCDWKHGELADLVMLPRDGGVARAITSWASRDEALKQVAEELRARARERVGSLSRNPRKAHPVAPLG
jgi:hypothetical protein